MTLQSKNPLNQIFIAIAMDYTTWPEFQQNQTQIQNPTLPSYPLPPPPPPPSSSSAPSYPPPQSSYTAQLIPYPQNPNPTSTSSSSSSHVATVVEPGVNPPGVESYVPPLPMATQVVGHEQPNLVPNYSYSQIQTQVVDPSSLVVDSSGYYFDPNAQNWAAREAVRLFGADPVTCEASVMPSNGSEQLAVTDPNLTWWTNTVMQPQATQPHVNGTWKKYPKKPKTKIVQPVYCEVCKIDCTSKEVLDQHKLGKKHKKNVGKLRELLRPPQVHQPALVPSNPVIGPQLPNDKSKSTSGSMSKRKTAETPEELEKKKKRVLEGGTAAEAVRICSVCNVICNSETVFNYHLAGQKHAAMVKKAFEQHTQSIAG